MQADIELQSVLSRSLTVEDVLAAMQGVLSTGMRVLWRALEAHSAERISETGRRLINGSWRHVRSRDALMS